jgi:hypothetical protein
VTGMIGCCCSSSHASTTWLGVAPSSGGPGRAEVLKLPVFCRFLPGAARLGSGTLPHREAESHPCSARPPSPRRAASGSRRPTTRTATLLAYSGHISVASLARYARVSPEALARWQA